MKAPAQGGPILARWIRSLIKENKLYRFYQTEDWKRLRDAVLMDAHYECEDCVKRGKYSRATLVHHEMEVKKRPDLALSKFYRDARGNLKKNLWALCFACHERRHDRAWSGQGEARNEEKQLNEERW